MQYKENQSPGVLQMPLRALRLRAGMALQTCRIVAGAAKQEGQFLAAMEGKGVMVGPYGPEGEKSELLVDEMCVVRGFNGQYDYFFVSKVLQIFEKPFPYSLLAYPQYVDATLVRKSMRTNISWPTQVCDDAALPTQTRDATLIDVSRSGAMLWTALALSAVGDTVLVKFLVAFEGDLIEVALTATICHTAGAAGGQGFNTGIAFKGLTQQDKLVLHYATRHSGEAATQV